MTLYTVIRQGKCRTNTIMNVLDFIKKKRQKHGKKAVAIFLVYFVTKWTLTIFFGAEILAYFKNLL